MSEPCKTCGSDNPHAHCPKCNGLVLGGMDCKDCGWLQPVASAGGDALANRQSKLIVQLEAQLADLKEELAGRKLQVHDALEELRKEEAKVAELEAQLVAAKRKGWNEAIGAVLEIIQHHEPAERAPIGATIRALMKPALPAKEGE